MRTVQEITAQRQYELDTISDLAATLRTISFDNGTVRQSVLDQLVAARARIDTLDWLMGADNLENN